MRRRLFTVYINLGDAPSGPELALNIVIDDSGSMAGAPIGEVRKALHCFIESAPEGTRLGLIGFGTDVHVYAEPTEYREFLSDQVDRFQGHSGCTMLYEAVGEACLRFQDDGRHRYVIVLTDGGDTGSPNFSLKGEGAKRCLIRHAVEQNVKVYAIGFGSVDRQSLETLAHSTGGEYLEASGIETLLSTFERILGMIDKDRHVVRLRSEFSRLLADSCIGHPQWLQHLSIDEWEEAESWSDSTHIKFPKPAGGTVAKYTMLVERELGQVISAHLEQIVLEQLRSKEGKGAISFPDDFDVLVVGWLGDPAFRAISVRILRIFDELRRKLSAQLGGDMYPFLVPLVAGVGGMGPELRAECYAWLHAISNSLGRSALRAVLSFGETNQDRRKNPLGYMVAERSRMLWQAANSLRCHALYVNHLSRLATPEQNGGLMVHSGGAGSLCAPLAQLIRRKALEAYGRLVNDILVKSPSSGESNHAAAELYQTGRLDLDSVVGELLQPVEVEAPEGILASIRLDVSRFWPPPHSISEDDYLRLLPGLLDERATDYLFHKLEALRRVLGRRVSAKLGSIRTLVASKTDSMLLGSAAGGIALAAEALASLRALLTEQKDRVHEGNLAASQFERSRIFAQEESAVRSDGVLSRVKAAEQLADLLRWRPAREALLIRHAFLGVSLGTLAQRLMVWLLPVGTSAGLGASASMAIGACIGLICLLVGLVRWRLSRQRIGTGVTEYVNAVVREARTRAMDETLAALRQFYKDLADWIGESDTVPAWDPSEIRTERTLSQRQILACLRDVLQADFRGREKRLRDNPYVANPSVWELGSTVDDPHTPDGRISLQAPDQLPEPVSWKAVADKEGNRSWREVCRRRLSDTLRGYLDFHEERVRFAPRIFESCVSELSASLSTGQTLARLITAATVPELSKALERLDSIAFPPLQLTYSTTVPTPEGFTLVEPQEAAAISDAFPKDRGLREKLKEQVIPLPNRAELHRLWSMKASISESVDWQACRTAWEALDEAARRQLVEVLGDPLDWRDPSSGELAFPRNESEPEIHQDAEGGL